MEHLSLIEDPRVDRTKKHLLIDILVITVLGYMSDNDNWFDEEKREWLKTFLELRNGIPSHDTFGRVFALIDPDQFEAAFQNWAIEYRKKFLPDTIEPEHRYHIAIDGKKIRGTTDHKKPHTSAMGMVNAWCSSAGLVLGQKYYDFADHHEKHSTLDLIDMLYLNGCIVTLDANGATQDIFNKIIDKKADFVVGLKKNIKTAYRIADQIFSETRPKNKSIASMVTEEENKLQHGRKEKRTYELIDIDAADFWRTKNRLEVFEKYPHIKCLGKVTSEGIRDGKAFQESRFFMTNLKQEEYKIFATSVRSHWEIENKLHWVLDVAFHEDRSTIHKKNVLRNVALVRRLAFNLLKSFPTPRKMSVAIKRKKAGWDSQFLHAALISQI
jgi:predicted transposase YbfD/YdcC